MSTQADANHAVVRAYCDAWQKGDAAAIFALYHDDITLHYFGRSPLAGDHVGKPAAVSVLAKVQQMTNRKLLAIRGTMAGDDYASVISDERWERDGRTMDLTRVLLYKIRDGKLFECWIYDEDQRAVDEFWA